MSSEVVTEVRGLEGETLLIYVGSQGVPYQKEYEEFWFRGFTDKFCSAEHNAEAEEGTAAAGCRGAQAAFKHQHSFIFYFYLSKSSHDPVETRFYRMRSVSRRLSKGRSDGGLFKSKA
ncbi:hypothetical protein CHARACLAT_011627 [Characodon lateralis]|uniref:Uncharacterized protein n=1 Tax=Characodon lateralis TaxID=208331 RepID=A0ABU7CQN2_9TELE|nr:hypothetical protein [Characodon lateralis]